MNSGALAAARASRAKGDEHRATELRCVAKIDECVDVVENTEILKQRAAARLVRINV